MIRKYLLVDDEDFDVFSFAEYETISKLCERKARY